MSVTNEPAVVIPVRQNAAAGAVGHESPMEHLASYDVLHMLVLGDSSMDEHTSGDLKRFAWPGDSRQLIRAAIVGLAGCCVRNVSKIGLYFLTATAIKFRSVRLSSQY